MTKKQMFYTVSLSPKQTSAIVHILGKDFMALSSDSSRGMALEIRKKISPDPTVSIESQWAQDLKTCVETGKNPEGTSVGTLLLRSPKEYRWLAEHIKEYKITDFPYWPLQIAVHDNFFKVVDFLIKHGADFDQNQTKEVNEVMRDCQSIFIFKYLENAGYKLQDEDTHLLMTRANIALLFIETVAPASALMRKKDRPRKEILKDLFDEGASHGRLELIQYSCQQGGDIGGILTGTRMWNEGKKILDVIAEENYLDILKYLLTSSHQIIINNSEVTRDIRLAFRRACEKGHKSIAYYLRDYLGTTRYDNNHNLLYQECKMEMCPEVSQLQKEITSLITRHQNPFLDFIPSALSIKINQVMHFALTADKALTPESQLKEIGRLNPLNPFATDYAWWKNFADHKEEKAFLAALAEDYHWYDQTMATISEVHEHERFRRLFSAQHLIQEVLLMLAISSALAETSSSNFIFVLPFILSCLVKEQKAEPLLVCCTFVTPKVIKICQALDSENRLFKKLNQDNIWEEPTPVIASPTAAI